MDLQTPAGSAEEGLDLEDAIRAEQLKLLLANRVDLYAAVLWAVVVVAVDRNVYPNWLLALWFVLVCGLVLTRSLLANRFRAVSVHTRQSLRRWSIFATAAATTHGVLWGVTASAILVSTDLGIRVFTMIMLGGMMAGGMMASAAAATPMLGFALPTIIPAVLAMGSRSGDMFLGFGVMQAFYALIVIDAALKFNRGIVETMRLRFALQISESSMAEAQHLAKVGSWAFDLKTGIGSFSAEAYRIFGVDPARFQPSFETALARVHLDDRPALTGYLAEYSASAALPGIDIRLVMDDGAIKYVRDSRRKILGADGKGLRIIGSLQDITERRLSEDRLQFANLLFKVQMEASPAGIMVVDANRHLIDFNERFAKIWGISPADLINPDDDAIRARMGAKVKAPLEYAARVKFLADHLDEVGNDEIEMADGRLLERFSRSLHAATGEYLGRVWFYNDITDGRIAERELQFANLLLKTQLDASPDGVLVVDTSGHIVSFNRRFAEIWQVPLATLLAGDDGPVLALVTSQIKDPESFAARVSDLFGNPGAIGDDEIEAIDGRVFDRHSVPLLTDSGEHLGRAWFFSDITTRRKAEALAVRLARFDVLTGLANRAVFVEAVEQAIANVERGGAGFAVLFLDLDHFKDVNDTLGHPVGDALLVEVANRLRGNTRTTDTIGRFGGDEFAIVATEVDDPADAALLAEKLVKAIAASFAIAGNIIYVEASVGIDLHSPRAADAETLLSHADVALYRAKTEGRGTYRFFTTTMDRDVHQRVMLSGELREALSRNELFLVYQPQVAAASGRITGVEALVRWRHPTRGLLAPDNFVHVAETTGLIGMLGHFVLWTACRQAKAWTNAGLPPIRIAVNVSALQFKAALALETDIIGVLNETGLPSNLLELELTESVLMGVSREHNDVLIRLRQLGVKLAIDDFGTGYSSLDYLRRFPVDHIKIAQSFIENVETETGEASIVHAILGLARVLRISVIAEGVATREQLELLQSWGCGEIQGFYFARPMTAEKITDLLQSGGTIQPHFSVSEPKTPP